MKIRTESLKKLVIAIIINGGSNNNESQALAEDLVRSNLAGHDSHLVCMLPTYLRVLQADLLNPNQDPGSISLNERLAKVFPLDYAS